MAAEKTNPPNLSLKAVSSSGTAPKRLRWRLSVLAGAGAVAAVLIINLGVLIWARGRFPNKGGFAQVYQGSCASVSRTELGIHFLINVLGTGLLAASNSCMQILTAPTRSDIDRAHAKSFRLNIGINSLSNLWQLRWWHGLLWWCLALSSVPIHLLYNSVIYTTVQSNAYNALFVSPSFLDDGYWRITPFNGEPDMEGRVHQIQQDVTTFQKLSTADCIADYSQAFLLDRSDVVLVTNVTNNTNSLLLSVTSGNIFQEFDTIATWMCSSSIDCNPSDPTALPDPNDWFINLDTASTPIKVEYCLSREVNDVCTISMSTTLLAVVIACNIFKLVGLGLTLYLCSPNSLVTVGDAIASFLDNPDPTTRHRSLYNDVDMTKNWMSQPTPKAFHRRRRFWFSSVRGARWIASLILMILALVVVGILLSRAYVGLQKPSMTEIYKLGFGNFNNKSVWTNAPKSVYANVLLANLPQLIFSILYVAYNGLYTSMLAGAEWDSFSRKRAPLRVSHPTGAQRSTFWLQLPYAYSVPLLIASVFMHWIITQSFFFLSVNGLGSGSAGGETVEPITTITCGFSAMAIITGLIVGTLMVVAVLLTSLQFRVTGMPLFRNSSAVISANCHAPASGMESALPLKWGAVVGGEGDSRMQHCTFSSDEVYQPVEGGMYQ